MKAYGISNDANEFMCSYLRFERVKIVNERSSWVALLKWIP